MRYSQIRFKLLNLFFCLASAEFAWSQPSGPGPLQKGIDDVKARIAKNTQIAETLRDSVSEHATELGEIIYKAYGQENDPVQHLIELKDAYDDVHAAVTNGVTGQVWPAVSQLGQAALDLWVERAKASGSELYLILKPINDAQQVAFGLARIKVDLMDQDTNDAQIKSDGAILQRLQDKAANIANQEPGSSPGESGSLSLQPLPLVHPPDVDLSALDNFILMANWLDLGNRAFNSRIQRAQFYRDFPVLKQFEKLAEIGSPQSQANAAGLDAKFASPKIENMDCDCQRVAGPMSCYEPNGAFNVSCFAAHQQLLFDCERRCGQCQPVCP
jgi:hypothetical protein